MKVVAAVLGVALFAFPTRGVAQDGTVIFRDDFSSVAPAASWTFVRENPSRYSLTARPGFFRIQTERGAPGEAGAVNNLFLREASGTFILETRVEFNPQRAQQFAGLVVYEDDAHAVALGLAHAAGDRGRFRGVVLLAVGDFDPDSVPRPASFYDQGTAENPNAVYLRLLRSGNQYVGAFSEDGQNFIDIGSVTNDLPDEVLVGLGAANGDFAECGAACDESIPADFDFFQIRALADDGLVRDATVESVSIVGPDEVAGGSTADFSAVALFSDGTSEDVSAETQWTVAPAGFGQIADGLLTASDVDATVQLTIVATFTQETAVGTITRTPSKLVRITPSAGPPQPSRMCGVGLIGMLPWMVLPLAVRRGRCIFIGRSADAGRL